MIELGQEGQDKVTGLKGIITARHQYLTGCDQYSITPPLAKKGENLPEIYAFDEGRIKITGRGILPEKVQDQDPGGPQLQPKVIR